MNYQKHYDTLILRAKSRVLTGYVEKHHIVPKCLGGNNLFENIVSLTPEEHFVAHQLLVKLYPTHGGLKYALRMMCLNNPNHTRNNKLFGWIKRTLKDKYPRKLRGKDKKPRKIRAKETKARKKRILTDIHKQKIGASHKGKVKSVEHRFKISQSNIATKAKNKLLRTTTAKSTCPSVLARICSFC